MRAYGSNALSIIPVGGALTLKFRESFYLNCKNSVRLLRLE